MRGRYSCDAFSNYSIAAICTYACMYDHHIQQTAGINRVCMVVVILFVDN